MQPFEKGHQLVLNQIHWAAKYPSFKKNEADPAAVDPVEVQDKGAQFGWSVLWLCIYGLQQENIPVAEALIGEGQKRQWLQGACMKWSQEKPYM